MKLTCGNAKFIIEFNTLKIEKIYFGISHILIHSIKFTQHNLIFNFFTLVIYSQIFLNSGDIVNISIWPGVSIK